ncbi:MAG: DUF5662 family protein [Candidatus Woesearchaeota archaeon]|jgi:hypothetical protein|nr:DUF5662 family protein [Candidatus Woesearchaeota archaeon]
MNKKQSITAYEMYIAEHTSNIEKAFNDFTSQLNTSDTILKNFTGERYEKLEYNIDNHDNSKWDNEEFAPYRKNFFPVNPEEKETNEFESAWNHHQKTNPHHWQYWLMWSKGETKALEMSYIATLEMLLDWTAMAYKFKDTPSKYYDKNKDTMLLHKKTRSLVEELLPLFTELANEHNKGENNE